MDTANIKRKQRKVWGWAIPRGTRREFALGTWLNCDTYGVIQIRAMCPDGRLRVTRRVSLCTWPASASLGMQQRIVGHISIELTEFGDQYFYFTPNENTGWRIPDPPAGTTTTTHWSVDAVPQSRSRKRGAP